MAASGAAVPADASAAAPSEGRTSFVQYPLLNCSPAGQGEFSAHDKEIASNSATLMVLMIESSFQKSAGQKTNTNREAKLRIVTLLGLGPSVLKKCELEYWVFSWAQGLK
jgi:hypothetical protein